MIELLIQLTEIKPDIIYIRVKFVFLGYEMFESIVGFSRGVEKPRWSKEIDLFQWWYDKTKDSGDNDETT